MFEHVYEEWLSKQIAEEKGIRRKEILQKGLGYSTLEFLRLIWYPAIGNLDHLYPEYEVRDMNNGLRYLDLAYRPGGAKGCIEIQDYKSHARDVAVSRFKDLCMKQAFIVLDDWIFMPVAYLSIKEDPELCKQLVLSFVGKFLSMSIGNDLTWIEAETLRFARRLLRPFKPQELSEHLRISNRHARSILSTLINRKLLYVTSGNQRYRTYQLPK